jgi:hypothetical protein
MLRFAQSEYHILQRDGQGALDWRDEGVFKHSIIPVSLVSPRAVRAHSCCFVEQITLSFTHLQVPTLANSERAQQKFFLLAKIPQCSTSHPISLYSGENFGGSHAGFAAG